MTESKHTTTIRIPKELLKAARAKALEAEASLSEVIRKFLTLWVSGEIELPKREEMGDESHSIRQGLR